MIQASVVHAMAGVLTRTIFYKLFIVNVLYYYYKTIPVIEFGYPFVIFR